MIFGLLLNEVLQYFCKKELELFWCLFDYFKVNTNSIFPSITQGRMPHFNNQQLFCAFQSSFKQPGRKVTSTPTQNELNMPTGELNSYFNFM